MNKILKLLLGIILAGQGLLGTTNAVGRFRDNLGLLMMPVIQEDVDGELSEEERVEKVIVLFNAILDTYQELRALGENTVLGPQSDFFIEKNAYEYSPDSKKTEHYLSYLPGVLAKAEAQLQNVLDKELGSYNDDYLNQAYGLTEEPYNYQDII